MITAFGTHYSARFALGMPGPGVLLLQGNNHTRVIRTEELSQGVPVSRLEIITKYRNQRLKRHEGKKLPENFLETNSLQSPIRVAIKFIMVSSKVSSLALCVWEIQLP